MPSDIPPNYYAILEVSEKATQSQIRDAYKRAALKTHPDRVPASSPERATRTRKFQFVNDAYFTLSDPVRRHEYDAERRTHPSSAPADADPFGEPPASGSADFYSWAWNFFTKAAAGAASGAMGGGAANGSGNASNGSACPQQPQGQQGGQGGSKEEQEQARQEAEDQQFADIFEEMLREEGMASPVSNAPTSKFWSVVGGISGGALGFIVANVPGMVAGAVAGNRLGAVRDTKGKSVYAVFQELPGDDKARLLSALAAKVFSHAVGV